MKRTLLIAICLLAGILLAGTATAKPKHKAKVDKDFFGVMAVDPSNDDYDRMADTGFGVSRFELSWGAIQTTREGPYNRELRRRPHDPDRQGSTWSRR